APCPCPPAPSPSPAAPSLLRPLAEVPSRRMYDLDPILSLAVVLVAGVASGRLARRFHLPSVTGQILVGLLLGPVLGVFSPGSLDRLGPVTHFALGLMAVAVGSHLHLRRLRPARHRLLLLVALEAILTPLLVFGAVSLMPDTDWQLALLLAVLAVSTAPATILALVKETRARGIFVRTLVAATALNNIAAIALFELAHMAVQSGFDPTLGHTAFDVAIEPLRVIGTSALLGGGVGALLVLATRNVIRPDRLATLSIIAILLVVGVAMQGDLFSTLLSSLFLGMTLANLTPDKEEIGHEVFANFEQAIFAVFFTVAGMELDFSYVVPGGLLAVAVVAARILGKALAGRLAMTWAGSTTSLRRYLGPALVPQAGLAVGLMLLVTEDPTFAPIRGLFLAVVLTAVTINEIIGPVMTRFAILRSGDAGKDRPRLIDSLHEENITTNLDARSMDEAIAVLVDLLMRSHHPPVDRDELLASVLEREKEAPTLLGDGLAIPHGDLAAGDSILGVMGISHRGIDLDAPDGQPVHCIVLLATPPDARARHLEVLAAFARAIGGDRTVGQQIFHARSPAHAYEILHAEEATEDL
ncbi:MAG: PTS sugar transporter subunit IIA, partial [Planctomycetota bacterium]